MRSDRRLPNTLAILFTRRSYRSLHVVYDPELLKRQTSLIDLIYFDLPFLRPVPLDSPLPRPGPSASYLVCHGVGVLNEFPHYNI